MRRLVAAVASATATGAGGVTAPVPAAGRGVAAAAAAGTAWVAPGIARVVAEAAVLLVVDIWKSAPTAAGAATAAAAAAGEGGQEVGAGVARRAGSGPMATGGGSRLGALPLAAAVSRQRRGEGLLEVAGQHLVDQCQSHSRVGSSRPVNGPPEELSRIRSCTCILLCILLHDTFLQGECW